MLRNWLKGIVSEVVESFIEGDLAYYRKSIESYHDYQEELRAQIRQRDETINFLKSELEHVEQPQQKASGAELSPQPVTRRRNWAERQRGFERRDLEMLEEQRRGPNARKVS